MIKKVWTVRSRRKLFIGLSFSIAGFTLLYTVLIVLVLEPSVLWKAFPWTAEAGNASKYLLLLVPLISVSLCVFLWLLARWIFRKSRPGGRTNLFSELCVGESFLLSLLLFFVQLDKLNLAKGINGSPLFVLLLILGAMAAYALYLPSRQGEKGGESPP